MSHPRTRLYPGITAALLVALAVTPVLGQEAAGDPTQVASDQYKVLFENDAVRVLETTYEPGEASSPHSHPDHVAIMMNEGTWRVIPTEGEPVEAEAARGDALWADAGSHEIEYRGETTGRAILVELKGDAAEPMMEGMADEAEAAAGAGEAEEAEALPDPVEVAGDQYAPLLENDRVRVLKVSYAPGAESAMHGHPSLVVIALTDATWVATSPEGETEEVPIAAGDVGWDDAEAHAMRNASDGTAEVILVEIKGN